MISPKLIAVALAGVIYGVIYGVPALAPEWNIEKVAKSMARLTHSVNVVCTAFAIHESRRLWLTMSHCVPSDITGVRLDVTTKATQILAQTSGVVGMTVFEAERGAPAIKLGRAPKRGSDILQIGYGGGTTVPLFYEGMMLAPDYIDPDGDQLQWNSAEGMPGMSGGPILDRDYRVVGVIAGGVQPTQVPVVLSYSPLYETVAALYKQFGK
jgi:hypothetical protein